MISLIKLLLEKLNFRQSPQGRGGKKRIDIEYVKPDYFNRHSGRDFLVLGTGQSIQEYGESIKRLVADKDLIIMGPNNITSFIVPDYHVFTNRRRFIQYASMIEPEKSRCLLSIYFTQSLINKLCKGPYDLIMQRKCEQDCICEVDDNGIIEINGTSALVMIMVSYVMGARNIYIAGVDGWGKYLRGEAQSHFEKSEYKANRGSDAYDKVLEKWVNSQPLTLAAMAQWADKNGRSRFTFITPGDYNEYYDDSILATFMKS